MTESYWYAKDWTLALDHPDLQICSPSQSSEDVLDIGVVTSRFGDGDTELRIAEGSHSCDDARHYPDDESQAHGASVLQHTLWGDKDPRADDIPCTRHKDSVRSEQVTSQGHPISNMILKHLCGRGYDVWQ